MPPKMAEAAADIDQRITAAVAVALAGRAQPAPLPAHVNTVSVKLPDFLVADPDMWFFQAEAAFRNTRNTQLRIKFDHVVCAYQNRSASRCALSSSPWGKTQKIHTSNYETR